MAKRLWTPAVWWSSSSLLVGACASSTPSPAPSAAPASTGAGRRRGAGDASAGSEAAGRASPGERSPGRANLPAVPTGYTELDQALGADHAVHRQDVSIQTQWIGGEGEELRRRRQGLPTATGISVQIDSIGSSHETVLRTRVEGGQPPDMAMLAQPTAGARLCRRRQGHRRRDAHGRREAQVKNTRRPSAWSPEGTRSGASRTRPTSSRLIWYPIKAFEAKGYTVPKTWDELIALSDTDRRRRQRSVVRQRRRTRRRDRLADHRLGRGSGPQDQGPRRLQPAGSPTRSRSPTRGSRTPSTTYVGKIFFTPGYVFGGARRSSNTDRPRRHGSDVQRGLGSPQLLDAEDPDLVWPGLLPGSAGVNGEARSTSSAKDIGMFPFPTIDPAQDNVEGSADTLMVLDDRPEVRAVAEFLATPEGIQDWITPAAPSPPTWPPRPTGMPATTS